MNPGPPASSPKSLPRNLGLSRKERAVSDELRSIGVLLLVCTASITADAQPKTHAFRRVKATQEAVTELLAAGYERSPSFRALVARIEQSDAIVLVQLGACRRGHGRSCVVSVAGGPTGRHIRIKVNPHTTRLRLIATIGHELYHAVEIIQEPSVRDAESARNLFRRLGWESFSRAGRFETRAALETEKRILKELYRGFLPEVLVAEGVMSAYPQPAGIDGSLSTAVVGSHRRRFH